MAFGGPFAIDLVTLGAQPSTGPAVGSQVNGPYVFNGFLYIITAPQNNVGPVSVWKSTAELPNRGKTWAKVDGAHSPAFDQFESIFDGAHTLIVYVKLTTVVNPPLTRYTFDLSTETWGASTSSAGIVGGYDIQGLCFRPNTGADVFLYSPPGNRVFATEFSGAFGVAFQVDTNAALLAPAGTTVSVSGVSDSTGALHLTILYVGPGPSFTLFFCYQRITPANGLSTFNNFPGIVTANNVPINSNPCVVGDKIVVPIVSGVTPNITPELWVGSPLSAPAFTHITGIDAGSKNNYSPYVTFDGVTLTLTYIMDSGTFLTGAARQCSTTDVVTFGGFNDITVFDIHNAPPGFVVGGTQNMTDPLFVPGFGIALQALDPSGTTVQRFFMPFSPDIPGQLVLNQQLLAAIPLPDPRNC